MQFLRKHWYDLGGVLAVAVCGYAFLYREELSRYQLLMWFSLISLFVHQLEEYRIVGTFPGMVNTVMYKSDAPDRYPLNTNTAFIVNVVLGWSAYFLAAVFAEEAVWLGIATMLVSLGNVAAHALLFNIKGKTLYNAGMATSLLLFLPCAFLFFRTIHTEQLVSTTDYAVGISLGMLMNFLGVLKLIEWMGDKKTVYIFNDRNLLRKDRSENCTTTDAAELPT